MLILLTLLPYWTNLKKYNYLLYRLLIFLTVFIDEKKPCVGLTFTLKKQFPCVGLTSFPMLDYTISHIGLTFFQYWTNLIFLFFLYNILKIRFLNL
jgi:hypothetical protein